MIKAAVIIVMVAFAASAVDFAVTGNGGYAAAMAGFSDDPFWYTNNTGGIPSSTILDQFDLSLQARQTGSYLFSSPFQVHAGSRLSVTANFLSNEGAATGDLGAVYLFDGTSIVATLYSARARGDGQSVVGGVSAGVSTGTAYFQGDQVTLGDATYMPYRDINNGGPASWCNPPDGDPPPGVTCGLGGSTGWVTSTYTPEPGTYELLALAWNTLDNSGPPTGLAVKSVVTAPMSEPSGTILLELVFVLALCFAFRHRTAFAERRISR